MAIQVQPCREVRHMLRIHLPNVSGLYIEPTARYVNVALYLYQNEIPSGFAFRIRPLCGSYFGAEHLQSSFDAKIWHLNTFTIDFKQC